MSNERIDVHEKALSLPQKPGVYIMLDRNREVIYVGKAKKLINRVSSYFRENPNHNYKTQVMVRQVWDFDYIVTDTEFEALVLENSLIKRHMPKYNILLKDDKGYPFIRVSVQNPYPEFSIVSKPSNDGARYFGPYSGRGYSKQAIDAVRLALLLPSCAKKFPRDIGRDRPCLNAHLGRCCAVCNGKICYEEYRTRIDRAIMLFEGKTDEMIEELHSRMEQHAEAMEFEAAAKLRDEIRAMERLGVRQKVLSGILSDMDVIALHVGESRCSFTILHYIDGALLESETEMIDTPVYSDVGELLSGFVKQYYMPRKIFPKEIYLSDELPDSDILEQWLTEIGGRRVKIITPKRGDKVRLVEMARENAKQKLLLAVSEEEVTKRVLQDLQKMLALDQPPHRIESYDISNTAGQEMVGSMVVFEDAMPLRRAYRKFKIKTLNDQDDCAAMREMLNRRMIRYREGDNKFNKLPDVILLDGGLPQTNAIYRLFREMNITVPVFGMVKDDRHRTRAIVTPDGREVSISTNPAVFKLIGTIQEEVHRFAIEYHRKLRSKTVGRSILEKIPGVGDARRAMLIRHFKSIVKIREATHEELCRVLPHDVAENVYRYFHNEDKD